MRRKVQFYDWKWDSHRRNYNKVLSVRTGTFLGWGITFKELPQGVGHSTMALIELESGDVIMENVNSFRFIKEEE